MGEKIEKVDRISDLPDSILAHIFSFLPTKDAVAAGILSRRYKFLWAQVPVIDLDEHFIFHGHDFERRFQFQNYVNNILLLNKEPCLRFCRLTVPFNIDSLYANAWIEAIAVRKIKELHLNVFCSAKLPFCIFEKLVVLRLTEIPGLNMTSLHLPNLRVLELVLDMDLNGGSLLRLLTSSCPVLQELVIEECALSEDSEGNLHVCSSTLKRLQIQEMLNTSVVVIVVPTLEYLKISAYYSTRFYASDLSSLREADICIPIPCCNEPDSEASTDYLKFINCLTSSSTLRLRRTKFKERIYHQLPAFNNLTCLELEVYGSCWCIIPAILERTPNLVNLIVACAPIGVDDYYFMEHKCSHVLRVPSCLLFIKVIEVHDFNDSEEAMEMISYLLMNARVLNEMKIHWFGELSPMEEMEIMRKLMSFNLCSSTSTVSLFSST